MQTARGSVPRRANGGHAASRRVRAGAGASAVLVAGILIAVLAGAAAADVRRQAFAAIADAYVSSAAPNTNFGGSPELRVDRSPTVETYLRFNTKDVGGPIQRATLELFAENASADGFAVRAIRSNGWSESRITFGNRPALRPGGAASGPVTSGRWVRLDVTPIVGSGSQVDLAVTALGASALTFTSREAGGHAPRLIVETVPSGPQPAPPNAAPTPEPDTLHTNEDEALTFGADRLLGNDSDPDGDPLTLTSVTATAATNGTVTLSAPATSTFAPEADAHVYANNPDANFGGEPFLRIDDTPARNAYLRFDVAGLSGAVTRVTLRLHALTDHHSGFVLRRVSGGWDEHAITFRNAPAMSPEFSSRSGPFAAGHWLALDVTSLVRDNGPVSFALTTSSSSSMRVGSRESGPATAPQLVVETTAPNGAIAPAATGGVVTFTPAPGFSGTTAFEYTVADDRGGSATAVVTVIVRPGNDAPVAVDDALGVQEDQTLSVSAADLLANDSDPDGHTLRVLGVTETADTHGTVDLIAGTITYRPDENYNGPASFGYTVGDGHGGTAVATVTVAVAPVNDTPLAADDQAGTTEDTKLVLSAAQVLGNDTDVDGDTLTVASVSPTAETHGTVSTADGGVVYEPEANYNGPASFGYTADDGHGGSASATISVDVSAVNDAPLAQPDARSTNEDTPVTFAASGLLANDSDVEGDSMTVIGVAPTAATQGAVSLSDGQVSFSPAANFNGPTSFEYTVADAHGAASTGTVDVTVGPVNDAPVAADDQATTPEEVALALGSAGLVANDGDVDGDALSVSAVEATPETNGTVVLAGDVVTYTPNAGFSGQAAFSYTVTDSHGGTATATVRVSVTLIIPTVETFPMPNGGDAADDPAIWVHPTDPSQSVIIGTDKLGGLGVYDLSGAELQYLADGRMNNVDLRTGFPLDGENVALVASGDRVARQIKVYKLDPATRTLVPVDGRPARLIQPTYQPMGMCMYRSSGSGKTFAFVAAENGVVEQWELADDGTGQVMGAPVRSFDVGGETEGCVADDDLGHVYFSEEDVGIWKYGAEPDSGTARTLVDATGAGGHLVADVEGLAIARRAGGEGYLLASSQGNSRYAVYERDGANAFVRTFRIAPGNGIDGVTGTDGIDVTTANLGPGFPQGLLVTQDDVNCIPAAVACALGERQNQNFKLVPWQSLGLSLP